MTIEQNNLLSCVEIEPTETAQHSVIWLHGLGADGNDFVPIVSELHLPSTLSVRFIFPHAPVMPVTINNGYRMRAWFDITGLSAHGMLDAMGIRASMLGVTKLIERENARGIASDQIVLAGFSQGGVIALYTGLQYPERLAGIMALSSCLPDPQTVLQNRQSENQTTPIFIAHGTEDATLPYTFGEMSAQVLQQAGYPVTWHSYPMGHTVTPTEVADIRSWLLNIWQK